MLLLVVVSAHVASKNRIAYVSVCMYVCVNPIGYRQPISDLIDLGD